MAAIPNPQPARRRGAIYVRVSTSNQQTDGTSLETQEVACRAHCEREGIIVAEEHVYREVHSGAELWQRPALTALRTAMQAGEFDIVVAYAVDRLSREQHHLGLIVSEAEKYGCALDFATEKWDETPQGKFMRSALSFMAELEREKITERTMRGKRARAASGKALPGPKALFGYRWNGEHTALVIYEPEAALVRAIFTELAQGVSIRGVADALSRAGFALPSGDGLGHNLWHHRSVQRMAQHPAYWGDGAAFRWRVEHRTVRNPETGEVKHIVHRSLRPADEQVPLPSAYPAIVSRELAMAVQERLAYNRTHLRRPVTHEDTLLNGFVSCGYCHGRMDVARFKHSGGRPRSPVYRCRRKADRRPYPCRYHAIAASVLDADVWRAVTDALKNPDVIEQEIAKLRTSDPTAHDVTLCDERLAAIAKDQANLAENAARLTGSAADPLLEKLEKLDKEKQKVEADRRKLLAKRGEWQARQNRLLTIEQWRDVVASRLDGEPTRAQKREVLYAVELEVLVYAKDDTEHDRYLIRANIPLDSAFSAIDANVVTSAPLSMMRAARREFSGG